LNTFCKSWILNPNIEAPVEELDLRPTPTTLNQASLILPEGAYTTFRTFERRRVIRLEEHFDRLEETARLAGFPLQIDRLLVRAGIRSILDVLPDIEVRIRLTLDLSREIGKIFLSAENLQTPTIDQVQHGVRVITRVMQRGNPRAKLTRFIATSTAIRQELPIGIHEAIMVSMDGILLEGLTSNFFTVMAGRLWTAENGVLNGLTREVVLEEACRAEIPFRLEGVSVNSLHELDEAFITSASRAVLPVVQIDNQPVGGGIPGPLTTRLRSLYLARIASEMEEI